MKLSHKPLLTAALMLAMTVLPGCLQTSSILTVLPDGTGKVDVRMAVNGALFAAQGGKNPMEEMHVIEMWNDSKGLESISNVKRGKDPKTGFDFVSFTAYFKDVNKVSLGKGRDSFAAKLKKTDAGGFELLIRNGSSSDFAQKMLQGNKPIPPEQEMVFDNFKLHEEYRLPGNIKKATHLAMTKGRVASITVTKADVIAKAPVLKQAASKSRTITTGPVSMTKKEIATFKAAAAKSLAAWPKLKAELEARKKKADAKKKKKRNPNDPFPS